jgi:predicted ribosomally synthesized peptide with SipW-like signal peptide
MTLALAAALVGGVTMAWFTANAELGPVEFTAGTVVVEAGTSMFYGVEYKDPEDQAGTLYEISVDKSQGTVTYTKLYDSAYRRLNALAFDRKNKRLYYADGDSHLYFYNFASGTGDNYAGKIFDSNTRLYNATFGLGYYWFVKENTDDLYKVGFHPDGTIDYDQLILAHADFTGESGIQFGFGDLALDMKEGIIYGSSVDRFFTYNTFTGEYNEVPNAEAVNLQLAFGADGELYGTVTREFDWYTVDLSSGEVEWFCQSDKMFGDLASNYQNNWNPGDCDMLRYYVRNTGTKTQYVRVKISGGWDGDLSGNNVSISLCNSMLDDWDDNDEDGYFYYKHILEPDDEALLCVQVCLDGEGTGDAYQGQTFRVNASVEAIQATNGASEDVWGWSPEGR